MKRLLNRISGRWMVVLKAVGITVVALLLSELLAAPFSASTSSIFSSPEKTDFILSDFFAQVADRRPVRQMEREIVIVDIDRENREGIADLLGIISLCGPKAVGVDVNFEEAHEDDSALLEALASIPGVVLPLGLEPSEKDRKSFKVSDRPFFYRNLVGVEYGATNLPGKYAISSIREFPVSFPLADADTIPSFVSAIARQCAPDAYKLLKERGHEVENIDYPSRLIPVMSVDEVRDNPEALVGKIVLVGAMGDASDIHSTPISKSMSGLEIHAYALATILSGNYYTVAPRITDYLISILLCFIIVYINIASKAKVKGLFIRFLQVALVFLVVRVGYELYVEYRIIVNFSLTLLMVAFGAFAIDVWNGTVGLVEILKDWWKSFLPRFRRFTLHLKR